LTVDSLDLDKHSVSVHFESTRDIHFVSVEMVSSVLMDEGEGEIELPRPVSIVTQAIDLQVVYNQFIDSYEKNQFLIYYTVISEEDKGNSRYSGEIELPRPVSILSQGIIVGYLLNSMITSK
jgi:hypothetical protein